MDGANAKKIAIILTLVVAVVLIIFLVVYITKDAESVNIYDEKGNVIVTAPVVKEKEEKEIVDTEKDKIIEWLPYIYEEGISPFSNMQMIDISINKMLEGILDKSKVDITLDSVKKKVTEIFGDVDIDESEYFEPDSEKSIYYFDKETDSFAIIPMGFAGIFKHQIIKEVTKLNDNIYVYTYGIIGTYSYEEDTEGNAIKFHLTVGDKDGFDLTVDFDSVDEMNNDTFWINTYANKLPIFRYTIKAENNSYILKEVEQIGY